MLGDQPYVYSCLWARKGLQTMADLWDKASQMWRRNEDLAHQLGRPLTAEQQVEVLSAIPSTWNMQGDHAFQQFE